MEKFSPVSVFWFSVRKQHLLWKSDRGEVSNIYTDEKAIVLIILFLLLKNCYWNVLIFSSVSNITVWAEKTM